MQAMALRDNKLVTCVLGSAALLAILDVMVFHGGWGASCNTWGAFFEAWRAFTLRHAELVAWTIALPSLVSFCHSARTKPAPTPIVGIAGCALTWLTLFVSFSDAGAAGNGALLAVAIPAGLMAVGFGGVFLSEHSFH